MNSIKLENTESLKTAKKNDLSVLFLPKCNNCEQCAACKTYYLLKNEHIAANLYFFNEKVTEAEIFEKVGGSQKIIFFAHYRPGAQNLFFYDRGQNSVEWTNLIDSSKKTRTIYGHVCFGSTYFDNKGLDSWLSYNGNVKIIFGIDEYEERMKKLLIEIIHAVKKSTSTEEFYKKIKLLYLSEIEFVNDNIGQVGYHMLLPHLHDAYIQLEKS